jgi:hypothetical protein
MVERRKGGKAERKFLSGSASLRKNKKERDRKKSPLGDLGAKVRGSTS